MVGHALEHDPRVTRRRDVLQGLEVERRLRCRRLGVDDRALAADRDRFLDGGDRKLLIDLGREADGDDDAFPDDGLESGQLELDRIGADRNLREPERTGLRARGDLGLNQRRAGQRNCCTGQHGAGVVTHFACDFTGLDLRQRRHHTDQQSHDGPHGGQSHFHLQPPLKTNGNPPPQLSTICTNVARDRSLS